MIERTKGEGGAGKDFSYAFWVTGSECLPVRQEMNDKGGGMMGCGVCGPKKPKKKAKKKK